MKKLFRLSSSIHVITIISACAYICIFAGKASAEGLKQQSYQEKLQLKLDGSQEDEQKSSKVDLLNFRIRNKSIAEIERLLEKSANKERKFELHKRLAKLNNQQVEITERLDKLKDRQSLRISFLKKAANHFIQMKKMIPGKNSDEIHFNLGEVYSKLKQPSSAEENYQLAINQGSASSVYIDSIIALGNLLFEKQNFSKAEQIFAKILKTKSEMQPYAHYKLAWCKFNLAKHESALKELENAVLESRKLASTQKKLGVEDEALSDMVLFYSEYGNPNDAEEYFKKVAQGEKVNELLFQLVKRYFEHGQHSNAKIIATRLLNKSPTQDLEIKLLQIQISTAEKLHDRELSLKTAEKIISIWNTILSKNPETQDTFGIEEQLRHFSQKIHYEAETIKKEDLWPQAEKSYETYLKSFHQHTECAEQLFRLSVVKMHLKKNLSAFELLSSAIQKMQPNHSRWKDAQKIRLQAYETAVESDKRLIDNKNIIAAYDLFHKSFGDDPLSADASYKAAIISKNSEKPEETAIRFRKFAENYQNHELAKNAISECLSVLIKSENWFVLKESSEQFFKNIAAVSIKEKIIQSHELAMLKLADALQNEAKYVEAINAYTGYLADESASPSFKVQSILKIASIYKEKIAKPAEAIISLEKLIAQFPNTKEAEQANLEIAKLYEKIGQNSKAAEYYLQFGVLGKQNEHIQSLTNAAVLFEREKEIAKSASVLILLNKAGNAKIASDALESACNKYLQLATADQKFLSDAEKCTNTLAAKTNSPYWVAHYAWVLEMLMNEKIAALQWKKLLKIKKPSSEETPFVAQAKIRNLKELVNDFAKIKFSKANEKPAANIDKKSQALAVIEKMAEEILKAATEKQIEQTKTLIRNAYLDFSQTMENAALPSKLPEAERANMKAMFLTFANDMKLKAAGMIEKQIERKLASTVQATGLIAEIF